MSFYTDALGEASFTKGVIKIRIAQYEYVEGEYVVTGYYDTQITTEKSVQPLTSEEIISMGFGEYPNYEYYELFSLKEIPIPSGDFKKSIISFNGKEYTIKRARSWVWDGEVGYFDYIIARKTDFLNEVSDDN